MTIPSAPVSAAVKSGAPCKTEGQVRNASGKKFTCIKSGKKLIWSKGVAIRKTAVPPPVITPTPTTAPTPTPNPTPATVQRAISEFNRYPLKVNPVPPVEFLFGADADPELAREIQEKSRQTFSLWSDFYDDTRPYPILYGSDKDFDWLIEEWRKRGYTNPGQIVEVKERVAAGGFGSVLFMRAQGTWSNLIPRGKEPTAGPLRTNWINHHVVHAIQQRITGEQYDLLPCWAIEGGAEFYGLLASSRLHGVDYLDFRRTLMGNWKGSKPNIDLRKYTEQDWLRLLQNFDDNQKGCSQEQLGNLHYNVGILINEVLMADHGHEKMIAWWQSLKRNPDWRVGFKEIYGINHTIWYRNRVAPYLLEEYQAWIPQPGWE